MNFEEKDRLRDKNSEFWKKFLIFEKKCFFHEMLFGRKIIFKRKVQFLKEKFNF